MGDKTPATTTQQQNSTTTSSPWSAASPLLQGLIDKYSGLSTAVTPQQTAAGQQLGTAAQTLADAGAYALPAAYNMTPAAAGLTPAAQAVAGSTGNLAGAAQNVIGSTAPMTGAAYGEIPAAYAQMPAAYNLMGAAQNVNELAPQSTQAVQNLFGSAGMLPSIYQTTQQNLSPMASGANLNPYQTPGFSDALDAMTQNITNQVKSQYAGSGRDPSGAGSFAGSLGRGLMQGEAPVIASQYNQNVGNMLTANQTLQNAGINTVGAMGNLTSTALQNAGLLGGLQMAPAQAQWQAAQAPLAAAQNVYGASTMPFQTAQAQWGAAQLPYQAALTGYQAAGYPLQAATSQLGAAMQPYNIAQNYFTGAQAPYSVANQLYAQPYQNLSQMLTPAMGLGGMGGTTTAVGNMTGTQTPANDPLANILGGISGVAGLIGAFPMSDVRAKEDIKDIGRTHDDQKIYSFKFKGSQIPQIGMLAQEIEKKTPSAVMTGPEGLKRVNYDLATRKAATMGMLPAYRRAA